LMAASRQRLSFRDHDHPLFLPPSLQTRYLRLFPLITSHSTQHRSNASYLGLLFAAIPAHNYAQRRPVPIPNSHVLSSTRSYQNLATCCTIPFCRCRLILRIWTADSFITPDLRIPFSQRSGHPRSRIPLKRVGRRRIRLALHGKVPSAYAPQTIVLTFSDLHRSSTSTTLSCSPTLFNQLPMKSTIEAHFYLTADREQSPQSQSQQKFEDHKPPSPPPGSVVNCDYRRSPLFAPSLLDAAQLP
jgi:hypothetical protein